MKLIFMVLVVTILVYVRPVLVWVHQQVGDNASVVVVAASVTYAMVKVDDTKLYIDKVH